MADDLDGLKRKLEEFRIALGKVPQSARATFAELQHLSERYEEQGGFLGLEDHRRLERNFQQWQRQTRAMSAQMTGARGRVDLARQLSEGTGADRARIASAERTVQELLQRQGAMGQLHERVAYLGETLRPTSLAEMRRAAKDELAERKRMAASSRGQADAVAAAQRRAGTMAGAVMATRAPTLAAREIAKEELAERKRVTVSPRGVADAVAAAERRAGTMTGTIFAANAPRLTAQALMAASAAPPTALQTAHATQQAATVAANQAGLQQAQHISLMAQMGPQPPGGGRGGGAGGGFGQGGLFSVPGGFLTSYGSQAAAVLTGVSIYRAAEVALQAYETRELGALRISAQLGETYDDVATSVKDLRKEYHLTAEESVGMMETLGRAAGVGARRAAPAVARFARAYQIEPERAAELGARMTLASGRAAPDLTTLGAVYQQAVTGGRTRLGPERFVEEAVRIAEVGGIGTAPMGEQESGRLEEFMGRFGAGARDHPAQAYTQMNQAAQAQTSPLGHALRWEALADAARQSPSGQVWLGEPNAPGSKLLNIRDNYIHQQIALENAARIPALVASFDKVATRASAGNPQFGTFLRGEMLPGQTVYATEMQREGLETAAAEPGGIVGTMTRPVPRSTEEARQAAERERQRATEGGGVQRRPAAFEAVSETSLVGDLQKIRTEVADNWGKFNNRVLEGTNVITSAVEALSDFSAKTWQAAGALTAIIGLFAGGPIGGGIALGGLGVFGTSMANDLLKRNAPAGSQWQVGPFGEPVLGPDPTRTIPSKPLP
jgi:hypothetical protein